MSSAPELIADAVERALRAVTGAAETWPALVKPCADAKFGDYQANGIMAVARKLGQNPRTLAETVVAQLALDEICEEPTVAGAGFINFRLKQEFVAGQIAAACADERLGVAKTSHKKTIVIDFSSPNVAKPMHVGHIRSTIIGDCLARVLRFLGHQVITDNHLGDWGTQFGMLIVGWKRFRDDDALQRDPIAEMERLYKLVSDRPELRADARAEVVRLQQGDPENNEIWQRIVQLSRQDFETAYRRLGVTFDHTLGESFYNSMLPGVVSELRELALTRESEGALCVFFEDNPELKSKPPLLIQKADGAFLYGTTDLAALKYRLETWQPDEIIYVTDARQQLHFKQLFAAARKWRPRIPDLRHVWFGSILGEDGKPLKTREGTPPKLGTLLDEAEGRALVIVTEKNRELPLETRQQIARAVGIGAVKYADLCQNPTTDYIFSWSKMLAMTGNTAPYMQYAYVRIQSIFRKAGGGKGIASAAVVFEHPSELDLAKLLLRFPETLEAVAEDDKPNWLTAYLYELAGKFSAFYDNCPVIQSSEPTRSSRLRLCRLTADVIRQGLDLLGIDVIEQM